jgi:hypothetical protein
LQIADGYRKEKKLDKIIKVIKADVNDEIVFNTIEDLDTKIITGITSTLKLPTGNLNNILIDFNFINERIPEELRVLANFNINEKKCIDVELQEITVGEKIFRNACFIPAEVFEEPCYFMLGLYGFALEGEGEIKQRISLVPLKNLVVKGSYDPDATEGIVPTPTVFEIYFDEVKKTNEQMQTNLEKYENDIAELFANANQGLKKTKHFTNVEEMKTDNTLVSGYVVKTLGYYEANDGGVATYLVREKTENDIEDNGTIHFISDTLVAEMIIENNTINIKQFGAKSQDENNTKYDIAPYLEKYMNLLDKVTTKIKLYIPSGIWNCSGYTLARERGFDIYGDYSFNLWTGEGTVITSLNDNQDFILNIGKESEYTKNFSLKNISISSADFVYNSVEKYFSFSTIKQIKKQCLNILHSMFGEFDNLFFIKIKGKAFNISSSWEIYFKLLNFRHINNLNDSIMCFAKANTTLNANANITACNFEKIMFEACHGDLIKAESGCNSSHNNFGTINFEDYSDVVHSGASYIALNSENSNYDDITAIHHAVINIEENAQFDNEINNIELNNFSTKYYLLDGIQYIYDTVVKMGYSHFTNPILNNVKCIGVRKNPKALLSKNNGMCSIQSSIIFNNLVCDGINYNFIFDTDGFNNIIVNNNIRKQEKINRCHYNAFKDFRTNIKQIINSKHRGNIVYDENAMCKDSLCVSLINTVDYPTIARDEIILPMLSKKLHLRAKLPSSSKLAFGTQVVQNGTVILTKNIDAFGTDNFEWYLIDYSQVTKLEGVEVTGLTIKFFANNDIDFNSILDCFYFE